MGRMKDSLGDTLFDWTGYPHEPGFVKGSKTSRAAADSIRPESLRGRVLAAVCAAGTTGKTCDEIEVEFGGRHQSISARLRELALLGHIVDTGRERRTRSGRNAVVYVVTPSYIPGSP